MAALATGRPRSLALGQTIRVTQKTLRSEIESPNVVAVLRGRDPAVAGEYVVYTAHLDGIGLCPPVADDGICNGARDNASGVAGMLAAAGAFTAPTEPRPRRSVMFVATTAEEPGLLGSTYFVAHPPVRLSSIVANFNLDGLITGWPLRDLGSAGAAHSSRGLGVPESRRRQRECGQEGGFSFHCEPPQRLVAATPR